MNYEEWQNKLRYYDEQIEYYDNMIKWLKENIDFLYKVVDALKCEARNLATKHFDIKTGEEIENEKFRDIKSTRRKVS